LVSVGLQQFVVESAAVDFYGSGVEYDEYIYARALIMYKHKYEYIVPMLIIYGGRWMTLHVSGAGITASSQQDVSILTALKETMYSRSL
jgi:hypothetical protein